MVVVTGSSSVSAPVYLHKESAYSRSSTAALLTLSLLVHLRQFHDLALAQRLAMMILCCRIQSFQPQGCWLLLPVAQVGKLLVPSPCSSGFWVLDLEMGE